MVKKIILFFSIFLTIFNTFLVLSCSKTPNTSQDSIKNEFQYNALFKNYVSDLSNVIENWYVNYVKNVDFFEDDGTSDKLFFNANTLKRASELNIKINDVSPTIIDINSNNFKPFYEGYINDIKSITNYNVLIDSINNFKTIEKYSYLTKGIDSIFNSFDIVEGTNKFYFQSITQSNENKITNDKIINNFIFDVSFNYNSWNNKVLNKSIGLQNTFKFTYYKSTNITKIISNVKNVFEKNLSKHSNITWDNIKNDNLNENKYIKIKQKTLSYFKTIEKDVLNEIHSVFNNQDKNSFRLEKIDNNKSIFSDVNYVNQIEADQTNSNQYEWHTKNKGEELYDLIFRKNYEKKLFNINNQNISLDQTLKTFLDNNVVKYIESYKERLKKYISNNNLNISLNDIITSSKVGYININNLRLFNGNKYIDIGNIKLLISYSINNEKIIELNDKDILNSENYIMLYNNLTKGIQDFQEAFGVINNMENKDRIISFSSFKDYYGRNYFTYIESALNKKDPTDWTLLSKYLSLDVDEPTVNNIWKNKAYDNQEIFEWKVEKSNYFVKLKSDTLNNAAFIIEDYLKNTNSSESSDIEYGEKEIKFIYKNELINASFKTDKIWGIYNGENYKDKTIFEIVKI
ncbi:hypothetical protein [Spiroplasma turonicum]|uniref:Lipoprotein n=1 Tax=Spiroplasma turonicum TaxID=216946 RepID=A0A0K1P6Q0_9MOLU|nr:hypothetical protein [Spiroplasma turonicum]AKU79547.1 hypothetical protein STURON_00301 [Spiroplasma turonicum]ALX70570.1 hypothetical protein STURO_v1c03020 [Spiroplasma turonicum]